MFTRFIVIENSSERNARIIGFTSDIEEAQKMIREAEKPFDCAIFAIHSVPGIYFDECNNS